METYLKILGPIYRFGCVMSVYRLNNNNAANFFENWWKELYYSKSLRDQIALPYSIWSAGFDISSIGCLGTNVYHSNFFRVYPH